jgi:hypothetical protein
LAKAFLNVESKVSGANFGVKVVGKGEVLDYFICSLAKIQIKVQEAEGVNDRDIEIVGNFLAFAFFLALLVKVHNGKAQIKESTLDEACLFLYLHLNNESGTCGILAVYVKHRSPAVPGFRLLNRLDDIHVNNRLFENLAEKRIEQEHKQFRALLVGKGFLECRVQSERSELWVFNRAGNASFTCRHNTSFEGVQVNGPKISCKKIGSYAACSKGLNIGKFVPQDKFSSKLRLPRGLEW